MENKNKVIWCPDCDYVREVGTHGVPLSGGDPNCHGSLRVSTEAERYEFMKSHRIGRFKRELAALLRRYDSKIEVSVVWGSDATISFVVGDEEGRNLTDLEEES